MIYYLTDGVIYYVKRKTKQTIHAGIQEAGRRNYAAGETELSRNGSTDRETARQFEISDHHRLQDWERIYLTEGPEGFAIERRGRGSKGRPPKHLPKDVEEDLLAEVQRLRAEVDYLKNLQALVLEEERRQHKKRW